MTVCGDVDGAADLHHVEGSAAWLAHLERGWLQLLLSVAHSMFDDATIKERMHSGKCAPSMPARKARNGSFILRALDR